jgi:hypothetical protein
MIAFIGKEGRDSSSSGGCIVIGELREWKEFSPVILLIVAIGPEVLFEGLISPFHLSVTFRMVTGCEMEFHI